MGPGRRGALGHAMLKPGCRSRAGGSCVVRHNCDPPECCIPLKAALSLDAPTNCLAARTRVRSSLIHSSSDWTPKPAEFQERQANPRSGRRGRVQLLGVQTAAPSGSLRRRVAPMWRGFPAVMTTRRHIWQPFASPDVETHFIDEGREQWSIPAHLARARHQRGRARRPRRDCSCGREITCAPARRLERARLCPGARRLLLPQEEER